MDHTTRPGRSSRLVRVCAGLRNLPGRGLECADYTRGRTGAVVARGLVAAHAAGSVHRDLKPENIFLTRSGATKILDFGIAKLAMDDAAGDGFSTLTGVVLGTAGYLAPEQIRGADIDGRTDLFALGAMLFEMLTGRRAFAGEHTVDTLHAILHESPPELLEQRHDVPPGLVAIVRRLLEKAPEARPRSAADLGSALAEVATTASNPASASSAATGTALPSLRIPIEHRQRTGAPRATRIAVWGAVILAAVVLAGTAGWLYRREAVPAPTSTATIAILPFRSLPDSADSQLLELGLADVVISRLNQLSEVRVLPLSATERWRSADPREAGRTLGADRVLTGSLQRDGDRVRASVQLLSISEGRAIWADTFDADATSTFSIQDAVVARALQGIAPQLSPSARRRLIEPGTRYGDAYQSYLRGRGQAAQITGADLARAAESFRHAVTLDPDYADAWAALGAVYRRLPLAGEVEPKGAFTEASVRRHARSSSHLNTPKRCRCSVPSPSGTRGITGAPKRCCAVPSRVSRAPPNRTCSWHICCRIWAGTTNRSRRSVRHAASIRICRSLDRSRVSFSSWRGDTTRRSSDWMQPWQSRLGSCKGT